MKAIQRSSEDQLQIEHGSLYPAPHRLERNSWLASKWETTGNGRPMKFYRLTAAGRKQLVVEESEWKRLTRAIRMVLRRAEE